jgi:phosphate transport system substrate-binding protein
LGSDRFQIKVLGGADSWAEGLQEFAGCKQMMDVMSKDRFAIAYTAMSYKTSAVKAVALAGKQGGPYVESSRETVRNGSYPLARSIYVYLPPDAPNGDPWVPQVDPKESPARGRGEP